MKHCFVSTLGSLSLGNIPVNQIRRKRKILKKVKYDLFDEKKYVEEFVFPQEK